MTRLFKRNEKTTIAELEDYYASQNQKKSGGISAWIFAILTIIVTVLLLVGFFMLGRWIYREVSGSNDSNTTMNIPEEPEVDLPSYDGNLPGDEASVQDTNGSSDQTESGSTESQSNDSQGVVTDQAATTDQSNSDRVAGTNTDTIPNTGAGDLLIILPVITAVLGYIYFQKRQLKK